MNYLKPGFREISRKFGRRLTRLRIVSEKRKLSKAEAELGLLGWQQADFDPETQREVDKVKNYEREQSRLTNEGAEWAKVIRGVQDKRETARQLFEETRRKMSAERRALAEPLERLQKQLAVYRKQEPQYEKRIPELDRELREVQRLYTQLLALEHETPQNREDLVRVRERTVTIPNEKADLRTQHMRMASEIRTLENQLSERMAQIAVMDEKLEQSEEVFAALDRELATEIKAHEREKSRIDKENDALETAKANPYQQIGRVLADSGIAPMNQPLALEKVCRYRLGIEHLEAKIQSSLALSAQDDQSLVRVSYLVIGSLLIAGCLLLTALWSIF